MVLPNGASATIAANEVDADYFYVDVTVKPATKDAALVSGEVYIYIHNLYIYIYVYIYVKCFNFAGTKFLRLSRTDI